jgi:TonB family protein
MPSDPRELLLLAVKSNGLDGPDMKPWHLKATFEIADKDGKTTQHGSYEEFWASAQKWKRIYAGASSTHTMYVTDHGIFAVGVAESASPLPEQVWNGWLSPMLPEARIAKFDLTAKPLKMGEVALNCVITNSKEGMPADSSMYCFTGDKPALRLSMGIAPGGQSGNLVMRATFNKNTLFQGRYVASSLKVNSSDGSSITAHIGSLELLPSVEEAEFTPPPDAKALPKRINISAAVAQGFLLHQVAPVYPATALEARMAGTIWIEAVITKEGRIRDAHVVSGAKVFQAAALDAVRQWTYRPYLLNGEPVEVDTTINVVFNLNPKR